MSQTIQLRNCNNFDEAEIIIKLNKLNIKYGANGTGKSTIAKALFEQSTKGNISSLMQFKHKKNQNSTGVKADLAEFLIGLDDSYKSFDPFISGAEAFRTVKIFNENYVNSFLFQKDEIVSNSFEIFVKTADYEQNMAQITELLSTIEITFKKDKSIEQVINDLSVLIDAFGRSKKGVAPTSKIQKSFGTGNPIENIPDEFKSYEIFLKSDVSNKWIAWQALGNDFFDLDDNHDSCPYCVEPILTKKETIKRVAECYKSKDIENLLAIQAVMERLGHYFSDTAREQTTKITTQSSDLNEIQKEFLSNLRTNAEVFKAAILDIKQTNFFDLKENHPNLAERIKSKKINLEQIEKLNSLESQRIVNDINQALDEIIEKISNLQRQISIQNTHIQKTIAKHKTKINDFLKVAGYRYEVDIVQKEQTYRMLFKHVDTNEHLSNAADHLSYGERNAFSIVLFMYDCLANNPDLIILDDPISSFDKTKKYAIMQRLFTGTNTLKDKTVLMMTHDVEPIIDIAKVRELNSQVKPYNSFLSLESGKITEIEIESNDLQSFAQICKENIASEDVPDIIKAIYLRRHYEILDNKGIEYQMLASLFHLRDVPTNQTEDRNFTPEEQLQGQKNIRANLPGIQNFDYTVLLSSLRDKKTMQQLYQATSNRYEKLQLFRLIHEQNKINQKAELHESPVIRKHINEAFHIENELIIQLNPKKYDFVPEYVITECNLTLGITG